MKKMHPEAPETDSRTQHVRDYLKDVESSGKNQPCVTVVPSSWAAKLEVQVSELRKEVKLLQDYIHEHS